MCGIIGLVNFNHRITDPPSLRPIHHRGPDGQGEWINREGKVYFGHTRLAIIEPTPAGRQPMHDANGLSTVTFNGEIYNHQALRRELPQVAWRSTSDTETLVELLAAKGLSALPLLKGMFAFAFYDSSDHSVLLVRDRLGIKPLWYKHTAEHFSFCSEIRPLLAGGKTLFQQEALGQYIAFGRLPGEGEIIDGISSVPPGGWMKVFPTGAVEKGRWWPATSFPASRQSTKSDVVKQVRELVTTAVEEHLISDVGVGAFLSGGIDSSVVTLIAGKVLGKRLKTFTVGFPQTAFDERKVAKLVASKAGSEHIELEVSENDCLAWVKEAVMSLDLPSVDAINTYIVSKAVTNAGLRVALSGLGGDELFGGYPSFRSVPLLSVLRHLPPAFTGGLLQVMPGGLKEKLAGLETFSVTQLTVARRRFTSIPTLRKLGLPTGVPSIPGSPDGLDTMGEISWAEMQGYMIPMLLRDSDQMSMAVALEIRVPFLDHKLVEAVLAMDEKFKKGSGVKPLLVEAFADILPLDVYNRPKQGFSLPMNDWMKGPLAAFLNEGLHAASTYLQTTQPFQLQKQFTSGQVHWTRLWKWSVLGHWLSAREATGQPAVASEPLLEVS